MPNVTISLPNGKKVKVNNAPEGWTPTKDDAFKIAQKTGIVAPTDNLPYINNLKALGYDEKTITEAKEKINQGRMRFFGKKDVSLGDRFSENFQDSFFGREGIGTSTGAFIDYVNAGTPDLVRSQDMLQEIKAAEIELKARRQGQTHVKDADGNIVGFGTGDPRFSSYTDDEIKEQIANKKAEAFQRQRSSEKAKNQFILDTAEQYGEFYELPKSQGFIETTTAILGQLGGASASPEALVPFGKERSLLLTAGKQILGAAALQLATEPIVQSAAENRGTQIGFNLEQALVRTALIATVGTTLSIAPDAIGRAFNRVFRGKKAPAEMTEEAVKETLNLVKIEILKEMSPAERIAKQAELEEAFSKVTPAMVEAEERAARAEGLEETFGVPKTREERQKQLEEAFAKPEVREDREIKEWAQGTKVVDDKGEPLEVYHGTTEDFKEFAPEKLGSKNIFAESANEGFFFAGTTNTSENYTRLTPLDVAGAGLRNDPLIPEVKAKFAKERADIDAKMEAQNDAENAALREKLTGSPEWETLVKTVRDIHGDDADRVLDEFIARDVAFRRMDAGESAELAKLRELERDLNARELKVFEDLYMDRTGKRPHIKRAYLKMENPYVHDYKGGAEEGGTEGLTKHIQRAKENGHDGVIFKNLTDGGDAPDNIYVVFNKDQIRTKSESIEKSAKRIEAQKARLAELDRLYPNENKVRSQVEVAEDRAKELDRLRTAKERAMEKTAPEKTPIPIINEPIIPEGAPQVRFHSSAPWGDKTIEQWDIINPKGWRGYKESEATVSRQTLEKWGYKLPQVETKTVPFITGSRDTLEKTMQETGQIIPQTQVKTGGGYYPELAEKIKAKQKLTQKALDEQHGTAKELEDQIVASERFRQSPASLDALREDLTVAERVTNGTIEPPVIKIHTDSKIGDTVVVDSKLCVACAPEVAESLSKQGYNVEIFTIKQSGDHLGIKGSGMHKVAVVEKGGKRYIYDQPQSEIYGPAKQKKNDGGWQYGTLKTQEYNPRLIEVTKDNLRKYYGEPALESFDSLSGKGLATSDFFAKREELMHQALKKEITGEQYIKSLNDLVEGPEKVIPAQDRLPRMPFELADPLVGIEKESKSGLNKLLDNKYDQKTLKKKTKADLIAELRENSPLKGWDRANDWAERVIAESGSRFRTGIDFDLLSAYAIKGANLIRNGINSFTEWSRHMIRMGGPSIQQFLPQMWKEAQTFARNFRSGFAKTFADSMYAFKDLERDYGVKMSVADKSNPLAARDRYFGRATARHKQVLQAFENIHQELLDFAKKKKMDVDELAETIDAWMVASHVPTRNKYGETGLTNEDAAWVKNKILSTSDAETMDLITAASKRIREINNSTLDVLQEAGILSKEMVDGLRKKYPDHVPFNRILPEDVSVMEVITSGPGYSVGSTGVKKFKGSNLPIAPVFDNIIKNHIEAVNRAEKNRVSQEAANYLNKGVFRGVVDIRPSNQFKNQRINDRNSINFYKDGEKYLMRFKAGSEGLAHALNGYTIDRVPPLIRRFIQPGTRLMSMMYTMWNPEFAIPNITRDVQEMLFNSANQIDRDFAKNAAKNMRKSFVAVTQAVYGADTPDAKLYHQMIRDGGSTGGLALSTRGQLNTSLNAIKSRQRHKVRAGLKEVFEQIENLNEVFENSTRFSVYKTALERGLSRDEAATLSKNITINFDRRGTASPWLNALYAFFNAAVQGNYNTLKSMAANPKQASTMIAGVMTGVAGINAYNSMIDPNWREKVGGSRDRSMPIILWAGDEGELVTFNVPVSYALRPFKTLADSVYDIGYNKSRGENVDVLDHVQKVVGSVLETYNAMGGSTGFENIVPTPFRPLYQTWHNENYFGGQIAPEPFGGQQVQKRELYWPDQGDTGIGEATIWIGDKINQSPEAIEYLLEQYTGGPGKTLKNLFTTSEDIFTLNAPSVNDIPIIRRFFRNVTSEDAERAMKYASDNSEFGDLREIEDTRKYALSREAKRITSIIMEDKDPDMMKAAFSQLVKDGEFNLPDGSKNKELLEYVNRQVKTRLKRKDWTQQEYYFNSLGVDNGKRAEAYVQKVLEMDEAEAREFMSNQQRQGLVTDEVAKQFRAIYQQAKVQQSKVRD